ncbi:hypothetical protein RJ640_004179 [Escallonia rubra]|uniref:Uncharacterized protein n=1 Tax=Escallonia rubra TaxID=112253 RepID=A0AA88RW86_9ASTE|nr:hypothetical protein RJ640_004179 [Escallonia rubra]
MEDDGIQSKYPRISNSKVGRKVDELYPDDEEDGEVKRAGGATEFNRGVGGGIGRLCGWPSSRIVRVSRASGGKDRHSKVLTSKGLRDRRVRLSVITAIQFYDLQDRLGCDQPSKAVEWLLKAAESSISELPTLNASFPHTPKQLSDEKTSTGGTTAHGGIDFTEVDLDGDNPNFQQQNVSLSKSACSSTSENSKGSGLSLSRSESRIKARERARGRAAEKEKEKETQHPNVNPISQNPSFTELLTSGIRNNNTTSPNGSAHQNHDGGCGNGESNLFHKSRQWATPPMDYFATGLLTPSSSRTTHQASGYSGHLGNSLQLYNVDHHHPQQELQQFSFVQDHLNPVATAGGGGGDYNLNFSISSGGLAGFNRGTLQSNSPPLMPHLQRFSPIDVSMPFFTGTATAPNNAAASPVENHHHQFPAGFDGRLQLCYGDGGRHSNQKGKPKN